MTFVHKFHEKKCKEQITETLWPVHGLCIKIEGEALPVRYSKEGNYAILPESQILFIDYKNVRQSN